MVWQSPHRHKKTPKLGAPARAKTFPQNRRILLHSWLSPPFPRIARPAQTLRVLVTPKQFGISVMFNNVVTYQIRIVRDFASSAPSIFLDPRPAHPLPCFCVVPLPPPRARGLRNWPGSCPMLAWCCCHHDPFNSTTVNDHTAGNLCPSVNVMTTSTRFVVPPVGKYVPSTEYRKFPPR